MRFRNGCVVQATNIIREKMRQESNSPWLTSIMLIRGWDGLSGQEVAERRWTTRARRKTTPMRPGRMRVGLRLAPPYVQVLLVLAAQSRPHLLPGGSRMR
jgi:hypothetical protein